jgi:hypothetical protein
VDELLELELDDDDELEDELLDDELELLDDDSLELLLDEDDELELLEEAEGLELLLEPSGEVGLLVHPQSGPSPAIAAPPERRIRNSRRSASLLSRPGFFFGSVVSSSSNAMRNSPLVP